MRFFLLLFLTSIGTAKFCMDYDRCGTCTEQGCYWIMDKDFNYRCVSSTNGLFVRTKYRTVSRCLFLDLKKQNNKKPQVSPLFTNPDVNSKEIHEKSESKINWKPQPVFTPTKFKTFDATTKKPNITMIITDAPSTETPISTKMTTTTPPNKTTSTTKVSTTTPPTKALSSTTLTTTPPAQIAKTTEVTTIEQTTFQPTTTPPKAFKPRPTSSTTVTPKGEARTVKPPIFKILATPSPVTFTTTRLTIENYNGSITSAQMKLNASQECPSNKTLVCKCPRNPFRTKLQRTPVEEKMLVREIKKLTCKLLGLFLVHNQPWLLSPKFMQFYLKNPYLRNTTECRRQFKNIFL